MKKKKLKIILSILAAVLILAISGILLIPYSRFHAGSNLKVNMRVKVNGERAVPYNITCLREDEYAEAVKVRDSDDHTDVSCRASSYGNYFFSYDVDTPDGTKRLSFSILKSHDMGPCYSCAYEIDLDQTGGDWRARILLIESNDMGACQEILLSDNETAYVHLP